MKKTFSIKLDLEMQENVADHARKMGREKQDVIREALSIGLQVLRMPEYYTARLNGVKFEAIIREVRAALKKA
jgi:predicted DNA-binding protein